MTPISIEQTTLIKFYPFLRIRRKAHNQGAERILLPKKKYTLNLEPNDTLIIKESHCLKCGSRLVKNGWNNRFLILDKRRGKKKVRLMRKRCSLCGEIKPDLSKIVPRNGLYHERFKRMARQHYMEGLMPSQIKHVFKIDFNIDISHTTIVNWINEVKQPLREMLETTPVPSSGYWGYDEIHMRISGERMYTLDAVDLVTKFISAATISESMGRQAGLHFFKEARRGTELWIKSIVKDCTANLGALMKTRSFKHIIQQNCLTHVKWIISKHVKAFAGLSTRSKKPLPKEWQWLLKRFYTFIDSKDETDAYIQLAILRETILRLEGKRIKHLYTALRQLISWFPKIIAHQSNPFIPTTNNLLESYHKKFTYYPSFKRNMMTPVGAQRVLDYRVFKHNLERFAIHYSNMEAKYKRWRCLIRTMGDDKIFCGQGNHFRSQFKKLDTWYGAYKQLWEDYFLI